MNGFHNSIGQVLLSLRPNAKWEFVKGTNEIEWLDNEQSQPTQAEIDAEVIRLQAEYDAQEYARTRATKYPALADQLDEIYHNGIDSWKALIKVTKDKYPKG